MVYVHVPQQSQRSQELAVELRATIAGFQARQPKTTADDVRLALSAVTPGSAMTPSRRMAVVLSAVCVAMVFGLLASLLSARENHRPIPWIAVGAGITLCLVAVGVAWARARDE